MGGQNAGGGGGGYGGGGGGGMNAGSGPYRAGAGHVTELVGRGGDASLLIMSESGPGRLMAGNNTLFVSGGTGGDGDQGGEYGGAGGGGGGYSGGGGMCNNAQVPAGEVGGAVGDGGDASLEVRHPAPSLSRSHSITVLGGAGGNGNASEGGGSAGGAGLGRDTLPGRASEFVPMSTPRLLHPDDGEMFNYFPPRFEWEPVLWSTTDLDVDHYDILVDNDDEFDSSEIDTGTGNETSFTPTSELSLGGTWYWHVRAVYCTGNTTGWGPVRKCSVNAPPVLSHNIPLVEFPEDTFACHLVDLDKYFHDDLFDDGLNYAIIYGSDPTHILGEVDGHFLNFSAPTKDWYGQERFQVKATDLLGLWGRSNLFTVRVTPVDDPPEVPSIPNITVVAGVECLYDLTPFLYDVDTATDALSVATDSPHVAVEGRVLRINCTSAVSEEIVKLDVSDGNLSVNASFTVFVIHIDRPPLIADIPRLWVELDRPTRLDLTPYVTDDITPPEQMRWTVDSVLAGWPPLFNATILEDRVLLVTYMGRGFGQGSLVLRAIDLGGHSASKMVNVTIVDVVRPPLIGTLPQVELLAGTNLTLDLEPYIFYDADIPRERIQLQSLSPLASVDGLTLIIEIRPDFKENRTAVTIRVTDGELYDETNVTVIVRFRPVISAGLPQVRTQVDRHLTLDLSLFAQDPNDPPSALVWEVAATEGRHFSAVLGTDGHTLRITGLSSGQGLLMLSVRNRYNGTDSRTISVSVDGKPPASVDSWRWPVTAGVFIAVLVILLLLFRRGRIRGTRRDVA